MGKHLAVTEVSGVTPIPDMTVLESLGFRRANGHILFLERPIGPDGWHTSLIVELDPSDGSWGELVIDNDFCQPYYYMSANPTVMERYARDVDAVMAELAAAGLTGVHANHAAYGVRP